MHNHTHTYLPDITQIERQRDKTDRQKIYTLYKMTQTNGSP